MPYVHFALKYLGKGILIKKLLCCLAIDMYQTIVLLPFAWSRVQLSLIVLQRHDRFSALNNSYSKPEISELRKERVLYSIAPTRRRMLPL